MQQQQQVGKPPQSHFTALYRPQTVFAELLRGFTSKPDLKLGTFTKDNPLLSVPDNAAFFEVYQGSIGN